MTNLKTLKWSACMERACSIAIIGGGPAGIMTAAFLDKNFDITIFEPKLLLGTLLPTGGGKCNITNAEPEFKTFAANYPRGEKFLYSVFSRFSALDAIEYFNKIGIKTITLDNGRVFPEKMDSAFVRAKLLEQISHCNIEKAKVTDIARSIDGFKITAGKSEYYFDKVVVTIGGHGDFSILDNLGVKIIPPKPALTGLCTRTSYKNISGLVLKEVINKQTGLCGDLLFTHFGVSGPLVFKVSSLKARDDFPYTLSFDLTGGKLPDSAAFQRVLNSNPKKEIKTLLAAYLPKNFVQIFLNGCGMDGDIQCYKIDGKNRDLVLEELKNYKITVTKPRPDGETVMAGGVDLNSVHPKTLECKNISGLFFAGEVLDIDGFCGGFNLQNCWSGSFIVANTINTGK